MAKLSKGLIGMPSGKIGNYVIANRNGKPYIRSLPKKSGKPRSPAQKKQSSVISAVSPFASKVKAVLQLGFMGGSGTDYDNAKSYLMKYAIDKRGPVAFLDYPLVLVTYGDLTAPAGVQASLDSSGELEIRWRDNSGEGSARATDRGVVVAYSPEVQEAICITSQGPQRNEGQFTIPVTGLFKGKSLHVYFSFVSAGGGEISRSMYVGEVHFSS